MLGATNRWFVYERQANEADTDCDIVDFDGCPGSESKDDFEGISPEQLNRMMEEMKYLIGETERREAALPVERYVAGSTSRAEVRARSAY